MSAVGGGSGGEELVGLNSGSAPSAHTGGSGGGGDGLTQADIEKQQAHAEPSTASKFDRIGVAKVSRKDVGSSGLEKSAEDEATKRNKDWFKDIALVKSDLGATLPFLDLPLHFQSLPVPFLVFSLFWRLHCLSLTFHVLQPRSTSCSSLTPSTTSSTR